MPVGVTVEGAMRILSSKGGAEGYKITESGLSSTGAGGLAQYMPKRKDLISKCPALSALFND